jgi:uncharacterized glyoxalase superfamily protein PhnB
MKIIQSALSFNVDDVQASVDFAVSHFGFEVEMAAEGVVSLKKPDAGFNLVFLRTGLPSFRPASHAGSAGQGTLVVFVVGSADEEHARLLAEGVSIGTPLQTEPWGQRFFQVQDPNGIVYELTHWENQAE